jgi:hypothetical protein
METHDSHVTAHHHEEHHELPFIRKYVFSMDHKIISKQFLFHCYVYGGCCCHYEYACSGCNSAGRGIHSR